MMNNMRSRNMMKTNYTTYFICFMIEVDAMSLKKIMSKPKRSLKFNGFLNMKTKHNYFFEKT